MRALSLMLFIVLVDGKSDDIILHGQDGRALIHKDFYICQNMVSQAYCRKDKEICDTSSGTAQCVCAEGWGGKRCEEDVDECAESYPCPGVKGMSSICIDYNPPIRYQCQCLRGFKPVYPDSSKNDAYSSFHPIDCIKADSCADDPCHPDATCSEKSSEKGFSCTCNEGLTGDGITSCSLIPSASPKAIVPMNKPTAYPTVPRTEPTAFPMTKNAWLDDFCSLSSDCTILHSHCVVGKCTCQEGFVRRKSECVNVNECEKGYMNSCHINADCIDLPGTYECRCQDGFHDKDVSNQPGVDCIQTNECIGEGDPLCNLETEVCIDRRPPLKWECVEKTLAPTKAPSRRYVPPDPGCGRDRTLLSSAPETTVPTPAPVPATPAPVPATPAPVAKIPVPLC